MSIEQIEALQTEEAAKFASRAAIIADMKQQTAFESVLAALFTLENGVASATSIKVLSISVAPTTGEAMSGHILTSDGVKYPFQSSPSAQNIPNAMYQALKAMNDVFKASLEQRLAGL